MRGYYSDKIFNKKQSSKPEAKQYRWGRGGSLMFCIESSTGRRERCFRCLLKVEELEVIFSDVES